MKQMDLSAVLINEVGTFVDAAYFNNLRVGGETGDPLLVHSGDDID